MIEKLSEYKITSRDGSFINVECNTKIINTLVCKINELVDAVNALVYEHDKDSDWYDGQTPAENVQKDAESGRENVQDHKIRSTNERLKYALSLAQNALIRLANNACDMDEHIYIDGILNQIERITKGGKDE